MANADPTTTPSPDQPRRAACSTAQEAEAGEWALLPGAHLNAALGEFFATFSKADLPPEIRDALLRLLVEAAKIVGVLEWLGEGLVVLPQAEAR